MKRTSARIVAAVLLLPAGLSSRAPAQDLKILLDLRGGWKFELGDGKRWAETSFDDSKWVEIQVPSSWEDQGFPGYDGYAWYRKHFRVPPSWNSKSLILHMGQIDDVDEVFVNGQMVGFQGAFPPHYSTAYNAQREYILPPFVLNSSGDNVIAVRVYDRGRDGGMVSGPVGVYEGRSELILDLPLAGNWKFNTGDDMSWKEVQFDDDKWKSIAVPLFWEAQGYRDYDGFGWYRVKFRIPANLQGQKLIMVLGKIDDIDEAYLNGKRIGRTGTIYTDKSRIRLSNEYQEVRSYTIPPELIFPDRDNVLAVRVYDGFLHGGIYRGPIGIVTREEYLRWEKNSRREQKGPSSIFDLLFR